MEKKRMSKKSAIAALIFVIISAILFGTLLLNKSDGPVSGVILSNKTIADADEYSNLAETHGEGIYLIVSNAFNKFQTDYQSAIPAGSDLYANIYVVECPSGSVFKAKFVKDGATIFEQDEILEEGPFGVVTFRLDGELLTAGAYVFSLFDGENQIFTQPFTVG